MTAKEKNYSDKLYSLIDRLQKCSEIKYPNRKWTREFYYECAFQWRDKIEQLEERVSKLEQEVKTEIEQL